MKLDEAKQILKDNDYILEGTHADEIPPENYELIEEILEHPFHDSTLTFEDLALWSYDDLENYLFELNDKQNEERSIYGEIERM